jgi:hypothetical protein
MGKDSGSAPQPDYVGAANAQGQQNIKAAQVGAELNRVNTNTPYGNLSYSQPNKNDPNQWQADVTLSPDQQALLDNQTQGQIYKGQVANSTLGNIQAQLGGPLDTSGIASQVNSVNSPNLAMYGGNPNTAQGLNTGGVTPISTDYSGDAQKAQDAAYKQQTAMLDPQYAQQEEQTRARLAASGIDSGTQAYSDALDNFNRQRGSDYSNARLSSIAAGNNEQATLAGEDLARNNQQYGQALNTGNFNNNASATNFNQGLALNATNNQTASNQFSNNLAASNFQNQARAQGLTTEQALRELPLNEYNALMYGNQVTQPNFNVGTAQTNSPAAAPVYQAAQAQGQNALDIYNQGVATNNSNTQAGVGLAATAIAAYF